MVRLSNPFRLNRSPVRVQSKHLKKELVSLPINELAQNEERMNPKELQDDIIEFLVSRSIRSRVFKSLLDYSDCFREVPVRNVPKASLSVVSKLPFTPIYAFLKEKYSETHQTKCPICLDRLIDGIAVQRLPCGHVYHMNCIVPWLQRVCFCPHCRYELPTADFMYEIGRRQRMKDRTVVKCSCSSGTHTCFFGPIDTPSVTNLKLGIIGETDAFSIESKENLNSAMIGGARAA